MTISGGQFHERTPLIAPGVKIMLTLSNDKAD